MTDETRRTSTKWDWKDKLLGVGLTALFAGPGLFRWGLVLFASIFPPIYLAFSPDHFTPLVDTLFSVFLFLAAYWIGYSREEHRASQRANEKWLPQAESVIFRLMTLRANVIRFAAVTKDGCRDAECELPELREDQMRAVRIKMKGDCQASSQRLADIAYQLEDAIEDWRRFIIANCEGDECERIFDALNQRTSRLNLEGIDEYAMEIVRPSEEAEPSNALESASRD